MLFSHGHFILLNYLDDFGKINEIYRAFIQEF